MRNGRSGSQVAHGTEWPPRELKILMALDLIESARRFVARYGLRRCETLDSGIHGSVHLVQDNLNRGATALKVHHSQEYYDRELAVYLRLREAEISEALGFAVPQLIRADDELLGFEMTVVGRQMTS